MNSESEMTREEIEKRTREIYHAIQVAEGEDPYIFERITSLITTEYFNVGDDFFVGKTCLDAGCGSNAHASYRMLSMGAEKVYAFDLDETVLESVPKYLGGFEGKYHLSTGNVLDLNYESNFFDFTHCSGVLHSSYDTFRGLQELARVTKVGGTLYIYMYGKGGLIREITSFVRAKYVQDEEFKSFVDGLSEEYFVEIFKWVVSEMDKQGDRIGKMIPEALLRELFDKDLVLTLKDRITTPIYDEHSEEELRSWLHDHGFSGIERLVRYPRYRNIRRFLSPFYHDYDHKFSKFLYGSGGIQLKAMKVR